MSVFVVTGLELGWDCVIGVFNADVVTEEELLVRFPEEDYVIFERDVEDNLEGY